MKPPAPPLEFTRAGATPAVLSLQPAPVQVRAQVPVAVLPATSSLPSPAPVRARARRRRPRQRQRGVAVVTALLLTTLAVTIVASLFWQQQVQVRSIENQRLQLQKQWILRGALDWARLILREDARLANDVDHYDEPWAVPLAETRLDQYVENEAGSGGNGGDSGAVLSGQILDAQARLNLNNLAANGRPTPAQIQVFGRLLASLRLDASLAQTLATAVAATQPRTAAAAAGATAGSGTSGTPDASGTTAGSSATPPTPATGTLTDESDIQLERPMPMVQVEDLLALPGFTPQIVDSLRQFVIFLPRATTININTASAEVLAASIEGLSPSSAAAMVSARQRLTFTKGAADVETFVPGLSGKTPAPQVAVNTSFFLVNGKVSMQRAGLDVQALIERVGTNSTRLIWIREN